MLEQKCTLIEAADGLKGGMFVFIKGYCKNEVRKEKVVYSEKSNVYVNADVSYERTYSRSAEMLTEIEKDPNLKLEVVRNTWVDKDGNEFDRKAKDRTLKENIKETITPADKDFAEAVAKVRKGIVDPKQVADNMEKVGKSTYDNANTGKTYFRNVLVNQKITVDEQGKYPVQCQKRVNAIADKIREMLPIGKYRNYVLDDEMVDMLDEKGEIYKSPRFEYIAIMKDHVSSSSSSEELH